MKRRSRSRINKMPSKDSLKQTAVNAILLSGIIRDIVRQELLRLYIIRDEEIEIKIICDKKL